MKSLELILLIITYSILVITIFISLICYKRNMEKWEVIAFAFSLLFLIISMTIPTLIDKVNKVGTTNIFVLLSMILVGLTTPLSVMAERQHNIKVLWKKVLYGVSSTLFLSTCIAYFTKNLAIIENGVIFFLAISVVLSMLLIRKTEPNKNMAHLEKTTRIFSIVFMILVPISLLANYSFVEMGYNLKIGFTLPIVFILLSLNKLLDDLQRLSLINSTLEPNEQHFKNYSLTAREKDVATLLAQGKTYKQISDVLFISMPTVKTHSSNIYKKCQVKNRHELTLLITS